MPLFGAAPAAAVSPAPAAAAPAAGSGTTDGDSEVLFSSVAKLSVYRQEKRNDENELVCESGWKPVGKGQLRLLSNEGSHFVEFRPEVSEGKASEEPSDEMKGSTRFGRPVLSALLRPDTKFEVAKKSCQANLWSADASGAAVFARYNMPLPSPDDAQKLAALVAANKPAA